MGEDRKRPCVEARAETEGRIGSAMGEFSTNGNYLESE